MVDTPEKKAVLDELVGSLDEQMAEEVKHKHEHSAVTPEPEMSSLMNPEEEGGQPFIPANEDSKAALDAIVGSLDDHIVETVKKHDQEMEQRLHQENIIEDETAAFYGEEEAGTTNVSAIKGDVAMRALEQDEMGLDVGLDSPETGLDELDDLVDSLDMQMENISLTIEKIGYKLENVGRQLQDMGSRIEDIGMQIGKHPK